MKIPWIMVAAGSQLERVEKIVRHCDSLSTPIIVLTGDEGTRKPYPHCNTNAFHQAARYMKGKGPWGWLEPDSIPLKASWQVELSEEYKRAGLPFMLASDHNPPHDLGGGIGIYPEETWWVLPKYYETAAWDWWMLKHLDNVIHKTPLIQHSYANYITKNGHLTLEEHRFPKDAGMIRKEAVLFHRDKWQDLIEI